MYRQNGGAISLVGEWNKGLFRDKRTKKISIDGYETKKDEEKEILEKLNLLPLGGQRPYNFDKFEYRTKEKLVQEIEKMLLRNFIIISLSLIMKILIYLFCLSIEILL